MKDSCFSLGHVMEEASSVITSVQKHCFFFSFGLVSYLVHIRQQCCLNYLAKGQEKVMICHRIHSFTVFMIYVVK